MTIKQASLTFMGVFVAACGGLTTPNQALSPGLWGGVGIQMTVTATGAVIDYGCDVGTIEQPLIPDEFGKFSTAGSYSFGRGGPRQPNDPPLKAHSARYDGASDGRLLQLTVILPELSRKVGDFQLERGRPASLQRCL